VTGSSTGERPTSKPDDKHGELTTPPNKLLKQTASIRKTCSDRPWLNTTGSAVLSATLPFTGAAAA
jgi:hypothetical protein